MTKDWGRKQGTKMFNEMRGNDGKVAVRGYKRGGPVKKAPIAIKPENKGKLHASLGVPPEEKIPAAKLAKAAASSNPVTKKRAVFAENAKKWAHKADGGAVKKPMKKEKC